MKTLPEGLSRYKQTPEFTESTIPAGVRKAHNTKAGTWGKIVLRSGLLCYRILEPEVVEFELSPELPGIVEPEVLHEVEPLGEVSFHVEFYR